MTQALLRSSYTEESPARAKAQSPCMQQRQVLTGPRFEGEEIRQISDMRFQVTLTSDHLAGYGLVIISVQRAQRVADEKE